VRSYPGKSSCPGSEFRRSHKTDREGRDPDWERTEDGRSACSTETQGLRSLVTEWRRNPDDPAIKEGQSRNVTGCGRRRRKVGMTTRESRDRVEGKGPVNQMGSARELVDTKGKSRRSGAIRSEPGAILHPAIFLGRQSRSDRALESSFTYQSKSGLPGRYEPFCRRGWPPRPLPTRFISAGLIRPIRHKTEAFVKKKNSIASKVDFKQLSQ